MKKAKPKVYESKARTVRLYCSPTLWQALETLGLALGISRGKALRYMLESIGPQLGLVAGAMREASLGRKAHAREQLASILGESILDAASFGQYPGGKGAGAPLEDHGTRDMFVADDAAGASAKHRHPVDQRGKARA